MTFPMSINLRILCKDRMKFNGEWDYSTMLVSTNRVTVTNYFTSTESVRLSLVPVHQSMLQDQMVV
jgi:hypothetical protein